MAQIVADGVHVATEGMPVRGDHRPVARLESVVEVPLAHRADHTDNLDAMRAGQLNELAQEVWLMAANLEVVVRELIHLAQMRDQVIALRLRARLHRLAKSDEPLRVG